MRLIIALLLAVSPLVAYEGCYSASADLLYWQPIYCPYDVTGGEGEEPLSISGKWAFGTRAALNFNSPCLSTQLSYLWFESYRHLDISRLINPAPSSATASFGFRYQNIDLRFSRCLYLKPAILHVFANARWVQLSQNFRFDILDFRTPESSHGHNLSALQGGALGIGLSGDAPLFRCLRLYGSFNPMAVIAQQSPGTASFKQTIGPDTSKSNIIVHSRCSVLPGLDLQLALKAAWNFGCLKMTWSAGYELNYYWKAYVFFPVVNSLDCRDLGFGGPFLRGTLSF